MERPLVTIERKPKVFVFSLLSVGPLMWAGLSDGYIRVFDCTSYSLLDEFRAHCGAINQMIQTHDGHVITASSDWTVARWDPFHLCLESRFSGHQNAVRSVAVGDDTQTRHLVASGGDDCFIRVWNLNYNTLQPEPYPAVLRHKDAITCMLVSRGRLLSAGHDGTVHVWSLATGAPSMALEQRPCAVTSIISNSISDQIWVGGVDGIITVYDQKRLCRLASLYDHSGAYVVAMKSAARATVSRLWVHDNDGGVSFLTDGEQEPEEARMNAERQDTIDALRQQVIANFEVLEKHRSDLYHLEAADVHRKKQTAGELSLPSTLKHQYLHKAITWLQRKRLRHHAEQTLCWLRDLSTEALARRYFHHLLTFFRVAADVRRKKALAEGLMKNSENATKVRYCMLLYDAALRSAETKRKLAAAKLILESTDRGCLHAGYVLWVRFRNERHALKVRSAICLSFERLTQQQLARVYWLRLTDLIEKEKAFSKRSQLIDNFKRMSGVGLLGYYFQKWVLWQSTGEQILKRMQSSCLHILSARRKMRDAFSKWLKFATSSQHWQLQQQQQQITKERAMWEDLLTSSRHVSMDALLEEEQRLGSMLNGTHNEREVVERGIAQTQKEVSKLQRDLAISRMKVSLSDSMSVAEQAAVMMSLLKSHGVNSLYDAAIIAEVKDKAAFTPKMTATVFPDVALAQQLHVLKQQFFQLAQAAGYTLLSELKDGECEWNIPMSLVDRMKSKDMREVLENIKRLVVWHDVVASGQARLSEKKEHMQSTLQEFLANSVLFLSVVNQEYQRFKEEGLITGADYQKKAETVSSSPPPGPRPLAKQPPTPTPHPKTVSTPRPTAPSPKKSPSTPRSNGPSTQATPKPFMGFRLGNAQRSVVITDCAPESPAFDAGLQVGDELLRFADVVVTDISSFNAVAARHVKVGARIAIKYRRSGHIHDAMITVSSKNA